MNQFTGYELLWLFLIYSFLGWVLETVIATVRQRKVVNRGLINGPFCIIYGIGAVLITIWLQELSGLWLFLFFGSLCFCGRMDCRASDSENLS